MKLQHFLTAIVIPLCVACNPLVDPVVPTPPGPDPEPTDPKQLYNGIRLPDQWPMTRNYQTEQYSGMSPYYLAAKPSVIDISVGRQLFVDNFLINSTSLIRTHHLAEEHPANPVLTADKAWENHGNKGGAWTAPFSDGVWYDEIDNKFKIWYMAGGGTTNGGLPVTCYAESVDGISWTKPSLRVVDGTNIVNKTGERDSYTVWLDKQETDANKRYKIFGVTLNNGNKMSYYTSSDGKAWRDMSVVSKTVGDRSSVYKNPFRNTWIYSIRRNLRIDANTLHRVREYMENTDPSDGTRLAEANNARFWFGSWPGELRHKDYPTIQPGIYNQDATPYESIMLGLFSVWQGPDNDLTVGKNLIKRNQIMLGYSRDGYSWYREDLRPFIAASGVATAYNCDNLQSAVGSPIIVGDKLYFYYSARRKNDANAEIVTTGLATLRRDGFASMSGEGELLTETLKFAGEHFYVNADLLSAMKVEILDADKNVIEGFSKDDCVAVTGNSTKKKVEWKDNKTLESLSGKTIRIKFYLTGGDLYSFWVSPTADGKSGGYTGGGGSGYSPTGIDK